MCGLREPFGKPAKNVGNICTQWCKKKAMRVDVRTGSENQYKIGRNRLLRKRDE
jgi:hypothetical protein